MEPDDIGVVMTRASELHASICDAIERVSQSRHLGDGLLDNGAAYDDDEAGVGGSSFEEEVRSLECIRDALEVLETQLESLQSVQQQQRIRKDAALAELEESRRVLLQRLKEHHGREMQVVEEAMTFAGEPVKKTDDLPLPPYLHPVSHSIYSESPVFRSVKAEKPSLVKQLDDRSSFNDGLFLIDEPVSDSEAVNTGMGTESAAEKRIEMLTDVGSDMTTDTRAADMSTTTHRGEATSASPGGLSRVFSGMITFTGKVLLVAVSVVAIFAASEFNPKSPNPRKSSDEVEPRPAAAPQQQLHLQTAPRPVSEPATRPDPRSEPRSRPTPIFECPPGYKRIEDDGVVKCIVKERVELPFPRGLKTPDVLHGRG